MCLLLINMNPFYIMFRLYILAFLVNLLMFMGLIFVQLENIALTSKLDRIGQILLFGNAGSTEDQIRFQALKLQYHWVDTRIFEEIQLNSQKTGLPISILAAVIHAESRGYKYAKGKKVKVVLNNGKTKVTRARGLMQIIPEFHWRRKALRQLYDPSHNIRVGSKYLSWCVKVANGNLKTALKNYNSGPNSKYYNWPYISEVIRLKNQTEHKVNALRIKSVSNLLST